MENKLSTIYSSYLDTNKSTLTHVCTHTHPLYPYFWQRNPIVFLNLCVSECVCRFGACPPHLIAIRCKVNLFHFLPFDMVLELCHRPFIKKFFPFCQFSFSMSTFFQWLSFTLARSVWHSNMHTQHIYVIRFCSHSKHHHPNMHAR